MSQQEISSELEWANEVVANMFNKNDPQHNALWRTAWIESGENMEQATIILAYRLMPPPPQAPVSLPRRYVVATEPPVVVDPKPEEKPIRKDQSDFQMPQLDIGYLGDVLKTNAGQIFIWLVFLFLLFIDWATNRWMMSGAHLSFGEAWARGTLWHSIFALVIMPSELYEQIVRQMLERTPDFDVRTRKILIWIRRIVLVMIVYDAVATFWPPFISMLDLQDIPATVGGLLIGALLSAITLLASIKIMEQTWIVWIIFRNWWKRKGKS